MKVISKIITRRSKASFASDKLCAISWCYQLNKPVKTRVLLDAAAQFKKTCLNEKLLKGPDYLNKLIGILLRFRREPYAVTSNIDQMYHQIKVAENDQDTLWFVWRYNTDKEIVDHMMKVNTFGKIDSPCIANWVIKRTASD